MKNKPTNYSPEDYPLANCYWETLAREGKMPKCKYPNNGVPKLRANPVQTPVSELYDFGKKQG